MKPLIKFGLLCLALTPTLVAQQFQYARFDVPGARVTRPFGVNPSGEIVGLYIDANNLSHGFVRNVDGTYTTIDYPGALFTNASSINARGDIVGRWFGADRISHGYLLQHGSFAVIDPAAPCVPTRLATVPHGINDTGDIVGRCFDANSKELGWLLRHDGSFQVLDVPGQLTTDAWLPTNQDEIVGDYSDTSDFVHGYTWTADAGFVTLDFPNAQTGVRAKNQRGDITGIYTIGDSRFHGFLLRNGVFTTVDYPGSVDGGGTLLINDRGLIVGGYIDAGGTEHGFVATECPPSGCK